MDHRECVGGDEKATLTTNEMGGVGLGWWGGDKEDCYK